MNVKEEDKRAFEEAASSFKKLVECLENSEAIEKAANRMVSVASKIGIKVGFDEAVELIKKRLGEEKQ
jgi:prefoldin subunit 5